MTDRNRDERPPEHDHEHVSDAEADELE